MYFSERCLLSDQTLLTLVFYDTLQHRFGSPDQPSSGRFPIQIITILFQKQNNKVKINA